MFLGNPQNHIAAISENIQGYEEHNLHLPYHQHSCWYNILDERQKTTHSLIYYDLIRFALCYRDARFLPGQKSCIPVLNFSTYVLVPGPPILGFLRVNGAIMYHLLLRSVECARHIMREVMPHMYAVKLQAC
jgi:hypothetical protein